MKIVALLIVFVVAAGCALAGAERSESVIETKAQVAALAVLSNITALEMLRRGDTSDAMSLLDDALDANITILIETPPGANVPGRDNFLRKAAEYRAKHPRSSPSRVDTYLQEYLRAGQQGIK